MTWLLWIAYKGTRYAGFQVQPNAPTVCAALQDAMQAALGCRPDVKGCSRTDSGVHARRFALSFCYDGKVPAEKLVPALNAHLPPDIRALAVQAVPAGFHARYAAHAKTYCYHILNARIDDPFTVEYCHRVAPPLDLAAMQAAAAQFVGTHDFLALCASGSGAAAHGDTVRTIAACGVERRGEYGAHPGGHAGGSRAAQAYGGLRPGPAGKPGPPQGRADAARQRAVFAGRGLPGPWTVKGGNSRALTPQWRAGGQPPRQRRHLGRRPAMPDAPVWRVAVPASRGARFEARLRSATAAPAPPCFICWGRIKKRPRHYINDKKGGKPL